MAKTKTTPRLRSFDPVNYLKSEKEFRRLYNTVARSSRKVPLFTLDPVDAEEPLSAGAPAATKWKRFKEAYVPERAIWASWSIAPFYLALILLGTGVLIVSAR